MQLTLGVREQARAQQKITATKDVSTGTAAPQALSKLASQLQQIGTEVATRVKAAEDTVEYSTIISDAKTKVATYYSARSKDSQNYGTLSKDTGDYIKQLQTDVLLQIDGTGQKSRVTQGFNQLGEAYHGKAVSDSTSMAIDSVKADTLTSRAASIQEASTGNDVNSLGIMNRHKSMMDTLGEAGLYTQEEIVKDGADFASDVVKARVRYMMNTDPEIAQAYLLNTQDNLSALLDPLHRENLLSQTGRLIDAREREIERDRKAAESAEAKALNETRDAVFQQSYSMVIDGTFDSTKLETLRKNGLLHKSDYPILHKAMMNRNVDIVGDPAMYKDMVTQMIKGDLSTREVLAAYGDESLNKSMLDELMTGIQSGSTVVQSDAYKTYLSALKVKLGWSNNMGMMPNNQVQLIGDATVEFYRRAIAGEDLRKTFEEMSVTYSMASKQMLPKPAYATAEEAKAALPAGSNRLAQELELLRLRAIQEEEQAKESARLRAQRESNVK